MSESNIVEVIVPPGLKAIKTESGCLEYRGRRDKQGYGQTKGAQAHRLSLEAKLGRPIRPGYLACHSCDKPSCINPNHLWEGTQKQNIADFDILPL